MNGASTTVGCIAADVCARQAQGVADRVDQQEARLHVDGVLFAIDLETNRNSLAHALSLQFAGLARPYSLQEQLCRARASSSISRCTATPPATSATPASSAAVGSCVSTMTPITVAMAGNSATISEYAARLRFAIASWSVTYGITDEQIPTPMPAASATGSVNACAACGAATGVTRMAAISIAAPSPSMPVTAGWRATRCASTM